jgi:hypothetical protein
MAKRPKAERQAWGQRRYRIGLEKVYFAPEVVLPANRFFGTVYRLGERPLIGEDRKWIAHRQTGAFDLERSFTLSLSRTDFCPPRVSETTHLQ